MTRFSNDLIMEYSEPVEVMQKTGGGWQSDGTYEEPSTEWVNDFAAIASLSENDLRQVPGGEITGDNRKAYTVNKWQIGSKVKVLSLKDSDDQPYEYRIQGKIKDYSYQAGGYVYHLVREGDVA